MPWISLIGMFTHVLLPPAANIGTCLFKFLVNTFNLPTFALFTLLCWMDANPFSCSVNFLLQNNPAAISNVIIWCINRIQFHPVSLKKEWILNV